VTTTAPNVVYCDKYIQTGSEGNSKYLLPDITGVYISRQSPPANDKTSGIMCATVKYSRYEETLHRSAEKIQLV